MDGVVRKTSEDDVIVLVAVESEVQVAHLPKMALWESVSTVVTIVSNADSFPLSPFQGFGQLATL